MGEIAPTRILEFFFYNKVLEILIIVGPIDNPKKKLQPKVMNPGHIPIRGYPHLSKILALPLALVHYEEDRCLSDKMTSSLSPMRFFNFCKNQF